MRIGIIGSGISGLVASYRLMQMGHEVKLFESKRMGGRILTHQLEFEKQVISVDMGAEYFVANDRTLLTLIDELDLTVEEYVANRGIFDLSSNDYVVLPTSSDNTFQSLRKKWRSLRYLGRKNLRSASILLDRLDEFGAEIDTFYKGFNDTSLETLFDVFQRRYRPYYSQSLNNYLLRLGITQDFITKMVEPLFHAMYMLDAKKLNALYGVLGFAAKNYEIYHVKGGNQLLIDHLFERVKENVTYLQEKVIEISKIDDGYELYTSTHSDAHKVDFVFAAMPLASLKHIKYSGFTPSEIREIEKLGSVEYNTDVYHHLVKGKLHPHIRRIFDHDVDTLYIANPRDIVEVNKIESQGTSGVFDVSSKRSPDRTDLTSLFVQAEVIKSVHWKDAYPVYSPQTFERLPKSNVINQNCVLGTDSWLTTLGHSVKMAELVTKRIEKLTTITMKERPLNLPNLAVEKD